MNHASRFEREAEESSEQETQFENTDSVGAVRPPKPARKKIRAKRAPSPAAVIARALDGYRPRGAPNPVDVLEQALRPAESDEDAFWRIWLVHRNYLRAHALRFSGGNVADAEDALSEAMLKAAQTFSPAAIRNHRAWLVRLVHNACMDRHRSNRRQSRLAKDITDADAQSAPAVAIQPDRSPEELLQAFQQMGDVQRALSALPDFLAEPLLLYLDDLSDAEIAGSLNVTREVVRKRRQIARAMLRRQISI
ncbi:MAG TPA: sigma-70 family RNA polymerase sigma factor [Rhizomicrobium sp.]|jgi:RNA polymerase sigma factor (sigma-70 family)